MATPPARTELADAYPNPSNAAFRTGIGKLWDYVTERLGATGSAADARTALGIGSAITFRNLLINANGAINQRGYVSATATTSANEYTLDRWRVVTSGQNVSFGAASPDRTMTAPAGGLEQVIEGALVIGGVYTLSWTGAATATVNGTAITNGGNTASLPANTNVTVRFSGGTVTLPQFELGTVATPFERRMLPVELQLCQRYYETGKTEIGGAYPTGASGATTIGEIVFKATKCTLPTMAQRAGSASSNVSANAFLSIDVGSCGLSATIGGAVGNYSLALLWSASAEL